MSCCKDSHNGLPCCCHLGFPTTTTTTCPFEICCEPSCDDGIICPEIYSTDCVPYDGPDLSCYNIFDGDNYTQVLQAILANICAQTTTTTSTTTTSTSSTTTTTTEGCFNSGGTAVPLETFVIAVTNITQFLIQRIEFTGTNPIIINWGDGTTSVYNSSPILNASHNYTVPFTGQVTINTVDLTKITLLYLNDVFGTNVPPTGKTATIIGTEIVKLDGLTKLQTRFVTLNCTTLQLPRTITNLTAILGNISGNVADLPPNIQQINLGNYLLSGTAYFNGNTINGNVSDLKSTLRSISILGLNTLGGDINTVNSSVRNFCTSFNIGGDNTITGDIQNTFNANTVMVSFNVTGDNTIFGNLDGNGIVPAFPSTVMTTFQLTGNSYPSGTTLGAFGHMVTLKTLVLEFNENNLPWPTNIGTSLTGDVADLPSTINFCLIAGANTVSGNVTDIPSAVYPGETSYINIRGVPTGSNPAGGNTITGSTSDIPTNCRFFTLGGKNIMGGNISNIPNSIAAPNLVTVRIGSSSQTVFGNLWNLPSQIKAFEITSGTGVITYVPPVPYPSLTVSKAWPSGFNRLWIKNATSVLSLNDMDQLLIDLSAVTWATSSSFPSKEFWVLGTPPNFNNPISNPAEASLIAQGVTITYV